ncbi:MAG: hypothetical protein JXR27_07735 [Paludibacteraceae bacterium]|nr:hypothetical protein [Paludibacteraceae bacterium]
MNRKLIVTLLNKNIEELSMITESFMELEQYPAAILHIAKRKTEDIQLLIDQLTDIRVPESTYETKISVADTVQETPTKKIIEPEKTIDKKEDTAKTEIPQTIVIENAQLTSTKFISEKTDEQSENNADIISANSVETEIMSKKTQKSETPVEETVVQQSKTSVETLKKTETNSTKINSDEARITTLADKIGSTTVSRNESHSKNTDNSLSATIANKKIDDIKTAISIGDRFRFQRELFRGNGEDMNKTLNYINQLATFDEVRSFLQSKYSWDEENENVENFYQIVKRKFI